MTIKELIDQSEKLIAGNKELNSSDIKTLIAYCANLNLAQLYLQQDEEVKFDLADFHAKLLQYQNGQPIQQLTNTAYFFGHEFYVNGDVLIPRYETEELVEKISEWIEKITWPVDEELTLIDIGTGSGAIAISLGLEFLDWKIYASDISPAAIKVAEHNKSKLHCSNVNFLEGDMLEPFIANNIKANVIVCNPPYIPKTEQISHRVKDFEPHVALYGGDDGLLFYKQVFENWQKVAKYPHMLCFEHGYNQKKALEKLVKVYFPTATYHFYKDLSRKWRMLFIFNL